ncbi:hypothetical protein FOA52_001853 [Chlamydomonas sp. UWO 241]|nr:hypothetical protein FOA52_001853 [Chlamydomonas sp. UWO 241]
MARPAGFSFYSRPATVAHAGSRRPVLGVSMHTIMGPVTSCARPTVQLRGPCVAAAVTTDGQAEGEPQRKTSKYKGVTRAKGRTLWRVDLWNTETKRKQYIGVFASEEDAARAYDAAAVEMRCPGTECNFPKPTAPPVPPVTYAPSVPPVPPAQFVPPVPPVPPLTYVPPVPPVPPVPSASVGDVRREGKKSRFMTEEQAKKDLQLGYFTSEVEAAWKRDVETLKQNPDVPDSKLKFPSQVCANPTGSPPQWLLDGKPEPEQP